MTHAFDTAQVLRTIVGQVAATHRRLLIGFGGEAQALVVELAQCLGPSAATVSLEAFALPVEQDSWATRPNIANDPSAAAFDTDGAVHLLRRLRAQAERQYPDAIFVPGTSADSRNIYGARAVPRRCAVVLVHGSRLGDVRDGWPAVVRELDYCWTSGPVEMMHDRTCRFARLPCAAESQ